MLAKNTTVLQSNVTQDSQDGLIPGKRWGWGGGGDSHIKWTVCSLYLVAVKKSCSDSKVHSESFLSTFQGTEPKTYYRRHLTINYIFQFLCGVNCLGKAQKLASNLCLFTRMA